MALKKLAPNFLSSCGNPVVALIGPRQCGKTTLARQILPPDHRNYFDLEAPLVAGHMEHSKTLLEGLTGLVVIDEAQRERRLFLFYVSSLIAPRTLQHF